MGPKSSLSQTIFTTDRTDVCLLPCLIFVRRRLVFILGWGNFWKLAKSKNIVNRHNLAKSQEKSQKLQLVEICPNVKKKLQDFPGKISIKLDFLLLDTEYTIGINRCNIFFWSPRTLSHNSDFIVQFLFQGTF